MRQRIQSLLDFNKAFVENKDYQSLTTSKVPEKKMVILSCMDTRLTELLPRALDIKNGDIKLIKNAGAVVVHPFGSIVRSVLVAVYEFGVEDILIIGHHGCGMANLDGSSILEKAISRGIKPEHIKMLKHSGIDVAQWLHGFESSESAVRESVSMLANHPLMPADVHIHGMLMDPHTGEITIVDNNP